jgi:hypothetical protein
LHFKHKRFQVLKLVADEEKIIGSDKKVNLNLSDDFCSYLLIKLALSEEHGTIFFEN